MASEKLGAVHRPKWAAGEAFARAAAAEHLKRR